MKIKITDDYYADVKKGEEFEVIDHKVLGQFYRCLHPTKGTTHSIAESHCEVVSD